MNTAADSDTVNKDLDGDEFSSRSRSRVSLTSMSENVRAQRRGSTNHSFISTKLLFSNNDLQRQLQL